MAIADRALNCNRALDALVWRFREGSLLMSHSDHAPLDSGVPFPPMTLTTTDGSSFVLPPATGRWTAVMFYRGEW